MAFAQPSIAGTVRDASVAVLPGVVVHATRPALIERTRTAVTDAGGRYRLPNVRPGTYVVTFSFSFFASGTDGRLQSDNLTPATILTPRFVRFTAEVDF